MTKFIAKEYNDECPEHGGEIRKEYDFGEDATIFSHDGCKCCVLITKDSGGWGHDEAAMGTWGELNGIARLQLAMNKNR